MSKCFKMSVLELKNVVLFRHGAYWFFSRNNVSFSLVILFCCKVVLAKHVIWKCLTWNFDSKVLFWILVFELVWELLFGLLH